MSWTLSVSPVPKEEFEAAVDAAVAGGQPIDAPGVAEAVAAAKGALKSFAKLVTRPRVGGSAGGHVLQEGDSENYSESTNASVYGAGETV